MLKIVTPMPNSLQNLKVCDLIDFGSGIWCEPMIKEIPPV